MKYLMIWQGIIRIWKIDLMPNFLHQKFSKEFLLQQVNKIFGCRKLIKRSIKIIAVLKIRISRVRMAFWAPFTSVKSVKSVILYCVLFLYSQAKSNYFQKAYV